MSMSGCISSLDKIRTLRVPELAVNAFEHGSGFSLALLSPDGFAADISLQILHVVRID